MIEDNDYEEFFDDKTTTYGQKMKDDEMDILFEDNGKENLATYNALIMGNCLGIYNFIFNINTY